MKFTPETKPFPQWVGPYSDAGKAGFSIRQSRLNALISGEQRRISCFAEETVGVTALIRLVKEKWGGGRVLFLPSGVIVKPESDPDKKGQRVVVGRYEGTFKIVGENNNVIVDFASPNIPAGGNWPGPDRIGLECQISDGGALRTKLNRQDEDGEEEFSEQIAAADPDLYAAFKKARPHHSAGQIQITVGGHAITKPKEGGVFYLGVVNQSYFQDWDKWIQRG